MGLLHHGRTCWTYPSKPRSRHRTERQAAESEAVVLVHIAQPQGHIGSARCWLNILAAAIPDGVAIDVHGSPLDSARLCFASLQEGPRPVVQHRLMAGVVEGVLPRCKPAHRDVPVRQAGTPGCMQGAVWAGERSAAQGVHPGQVRGVGTRQMQQQPHTNCSQQERPPSPPPVSFVLEATA
jgi:hypothetical protein